MIETKKLTKRFGDITAVDRIDARIQDANVFGLIGTNGAGKSTFLRLLCGILKPEEGCVLVDGSPVYENEDLKRNIFYISDDQHYLSSSTPEDMVRFCSAFYPDFDRERAFRLFTAFGLDRGRKITTFSKGMKKQLSVILGLCSRTRYLLCDETFDGLDPVMRQAVKSLFAEDIADRGLTPVIASHNLRELEDICDHVGLLHRGGVLLSRDLQDMKLGIHKIQCVPSSPDAFPETADADPLSAARVLFPSLEPVLAEKHGSILLLTVRGSEEEIRSVLSDSDLLFYEMVPLTLEEIFISETEVNGYDVKKLIL